MIRNTQSRFCCCCGSIHISTSISCSVCLWIHLSLNSECHLKEGAQTRVENDLPWFFFYIFLNTVLTLQHTIRRDLYQKEMQNNHSFCVCDPTQPKNSRSSVDKSWGSLTLDSHNITSGYLPCAHIKHWQSILHLYMLTAF